MGFAPGWGADPLLVGSAEPLISLASGDPKGLNSFSV